MINFVIQSHNKSTLTGGGNRRIPTDRFQFPAFHATASPLSHSLCAAHRSFNALLVRALCFGEDDWGFSPFFKLPLGYFHLRPSSSSSSPFCCISSLSLYAFHAFFLSRLVRRRRYCFAGVFRSLTWPSTTIAIGASFVSIGSLFSSYRRLLRSFREQAFWRRFFSFPFFPVAVEASA